MTNAEILRLLPKRARMARRLGDMENRIFILEQAAGSLKRKLDWMVFAKNIQGVAVEEERYSDRGWIKALGHDKEMSARYYKAVGVDSMWACSYHPYAYSLREWSGLAFKSKRAARDAAIKWVVRGVATYAKGVRG